MDFVFIMEETVGIHLSRKYANATGGLCGNPDCDLRDLIANGTLEHLHLGHFGTL